MRGGLVGAGVVGGAVGGGVVGAVAGAVVDRGVVVEVAPRPVVLVAAPCAVVTVGPPVETAEAAFELVVVASGMEAPVSLAGVGAEGPPESATAESSVSVDAAAVDDAAGVVASREPPASLHATLRPVIATRVSARRPTSDGVRVAVPVVRAPRARGPSFDAAPL